MTRLEISVILIVPEAAVYCDPSNLRDEIRAQPSASVGGVHSPCGGLHILWLAHLGKGGWRHVNEGLTSTELYDGM